MSSCHNQMRITHIDQKLIVNKQKSIYLYYKKLLVSVLAHQGYDLSTFLSLLVFREDFENITMSLQEAFMGYEDLTTSGPLDHG